MTRFARALCAVLLLLVPARGNAGLFWQQGVRTTPVSVCFVGNALTVRADRVAQILEYIGDFALYANVRFTYLGTCPASVPQGGKDWFGGDMRVVIPGTSVSGLGMVPGLGCPMFGGAAAYNGDNDDWGSWSNAPDDLAANRPCLYNLKLGDDPWNATPYRNHTLHEFGHGLGLAHEHARADATCPGPGGTTVGYLTPYDPQSVMHYQFLSCGVAGNYAHTGLSYFDRLSMRILYPETGLPAQIVGRKTLQAGELAVLQFGWRYEGAYMPYVAQSMLWRIDGVAFSPAVDFAHTFASPGEYTVSLSVTDFLGRVHTGSTTVRVLGATAMNGLMGTLAAVDTMLAATLPNAIFASGFE